MYVHFLLGLGGWVGAPDDEDAASGEAAVPPADVPRAAREPRSWCRSGPPAHRCRRRAPEPRT